MSSTMNDRRRRLYKHPKNFIDHTTSKRLDGSEETRSHERDNSLHRKRDENSYTETSMNQPNRVKGSHIECSMNQPNRVEISNGEISPNRQLVDEIRANMLVRKETIGNILCCQCGTPTPPNNANRCKFCLRVECNVASLLPDRINIIYCPDCDSYLQPPKSWLKAERESKELLTFCLKRLKKMSEVRLVDAKFKYTEPHSKRLKVVVRVQKEVLDKVIVEKPHEIEYVVRHQMCRDCMPTDPNRWEALVQVRQFVPHMRTFFSLEQLIIKHNAALRAAKVKQVPQGIEFYFPRKTDAEKFFALLSRIIPIKKEKFSKQLISQDMKSNNSRYKYTVCAVICPICHDDIVYLPSKDSASLGHLGPLVICLKVRNTLTLLDPATLKHCVMSADQYFRTEFKPLLTSKQLVEYIVLDVEIVSSATESRWHGYTLADVEIARVSDFGKNDRISSVRTHLGHLLNPGDYALGYDLWGANFNNSDAENCRNALPEVILIKKIYKDEKRQKKSKKARSKEQDNSEYEQFVKDLEKNPESRFNLSLDMHKERSSLNDSVASDEDETVSVSQLEDDFGDLDMSEGEESEDDCIPDAE